MKERPKSHEDMSLVHHSFGKGSQTANAQYVYKVGSHTFRATVVIDTSYEHQSHAYVEVLTPALTWTQLATAPTAEWWNALSFVEQDGRNVRITSVSEAPQLLTDLAARLVVTAAAIVG